MKCERLLALRLNKWAKGSTIILFKRTQDGRPNHRNHTLTDLADQLTSGKLSLAQELDIGQSSEYSPERDLLANPFSVQIY